MYRTVDCATWDDPWFADLDPQAKLLFLYFLTNRRSTAAGCFEITMRAIAFETGMQAGEVERHLGGSLKSRIQWFPDHQVIFVRNFYRHQSANSNKANFRASAMKVLAEMPAVVRATVGDVYPDLRTEEPTHPQPIPNPSPTLGDKEEEEETVEVEVEVTEAVEGEEANARAREKPDPLQGFDQFWSQYPRKTGKQDAERAWVKLAPSVELQAEINAAVARQTTWEQWQEGFIPHPSTFLNRGRWKDEEPPRRGGRRASPAPRLSVFEQNMANAAQVEQMIAGTYQPEDIPDSVFETTGGVR